MRSSAFPEGLMSQTVFVSVCAAKTSWLYFTEMTTVSGSTRPTLT